MTYLLTLTGAVGLILQEGGGQDCGTLPWVRNTTRPSLSNLQSNSEAVGQNTNRGVHLIVRQ